MGDSCHGVATASCASAGVRASWAEESSGARAEGEGLNDQPFSVPTCGGVGGCSRHQIPPQVVANSEQGRLRLLGPVAIWCLGGVSTGRRRGPWQSCQLFRQPRAPAQECRGLAGRRACC